MSKFAIRLLTLACSRWRWWQRPSSPRSTPRPTAIHRRRRRSRARRRKSSEVQTRAARTPHSPTGIAPPTPRSMTAATMPRAIAQLKALGRDDSAAVANLIGYSYRKLGDYKVSQIWYERALKADPNHVKTWQYYGLWQVEQGNRDQAQYHLNRIAALAGTGSEEYRSLAAALEKPPGTGLRLLIHATLHQPARPSKVAPALFCPIAFRHSRLLFDRSPTAASSDISGDGARGTMAAIRDRILPRLDRIPVAGLAAAGLHRRHRPSRQGRRRICVRPCQSRHRRKAHPAPPLPDRFAFQEFHRGRNHEAAGAAQVAAGRSGRAICEGPASASRRNHHRATSARTAPALPATGTIPASSRPAALPQREGTDGGLQLPPPSRPIRVSNTRTTGSDCSAW